MDTLALFRQQVRTSRDLHVSATGNDTHDGLTAGTAKRQISAAIGIAQAGDRILVGAGTYSSASFYDKHGAASAWITIEAASGAVIDGTDGNDGAAALDVQLSSYIGVYGLEVAGDQNMSPVSISGVAVFRGSHHIRVWGCHVHDFPSGGINCFYIQANDGLPAGGWDLVDIRFNRIHGCCKFDPNNSSGVSVFGAEDITGTTWNGRYGYIVAGNYIFDCECTVPYTPGGFDFITDGNGISLDSLDTATVFNAGNAPYVKYGLVEGNVVVGCGGRGLHVYNTINVDDFANTYIGNLRTVSQAITNGVETDATYDTTPGSPGVTHAGNIICPLNTPNTTDAVSVYTGNVILGGTQAVPAGNIDHVGDGLSYFAGSLTQSDLLTAQTLSAFIPAVPDSVARPAGTLGYQCLANGPRAAAEWSAGAVEKPIEPTYLLAT